MALVFHHSAEEPARCALEIAEALQKHPELPVRMGIHSGPVSEVTDVSGRTNLAGAGINMAQRVMDCGDAGHILLSQHVADDLVQYRQWAPRLHDLGECGIGNRWLPADHPEVVAKRAGSVVSDRSIARMRGAEEVGCGQSGATGCTSWPKTDVAKGWSGRLNYCWASHGEDRLPPPTDGGPGSRKPARAPAFRFIGGCDVKSD